MKSWMIYIFVAIQIAALTPTPTYSSVIPEVRLFGHILTNVSREVITRDVKAGGSMPVGTIDIDKSEIYYTILRDAIRNNGVMSYGPIDEEKYARFRIPLGLTYCHFYFTKKGEIARVVFSSWESKKAHIAAEELSKYYGAPEGTEENFPYWVSKDNVRIFFEKSSFGGWSEEYDLVYQTDKYETWVLENQKQEESHQGKSNLRFYNPRGGN